MVFPTDFFGGMGGLNKKSLQKLTCFYTIKKVLIKKSKVYKPNSLTERKQTEPFPTPQRK